MVAAAADLAQPEPFCGGGLAAGLGCALWLVAMLLLRRDFSKPETCFLGAFALITFSALTVSGSVFNWVLAIVLPLILLLTPKPQNPAETGRFRTWWGYWLARRKAGARGRWSWLRQILPTLITVFVGVALFVAFLCIFASGNPVVLLVWETLCKWWNTLVEWLQLDWDFVWHLFLWFMGFVVFGFYTFQRPSEPAPLPRVADAPRAGSVSLLPYLPLVSLLGINLAFLIATSTDIAYLWFGRVPEGVSQTAYLHDGAASITWAAALASAILVFLFRRKGSARQGKATRFLGYALVLQTFLLAASVYVRLYHQIDDYGFTTRRIQAAEAMLLGLDGLIILVCYMACSGSFWKYTRICLGSMLLIFISFGICPPAELAGHLNLRYAPSHPEWVFSTSDFSRSSFQIESNLAFALYVKERLPEPVQYFDDRIRDAAEDLVKQSKEATWRNWTLSRSRDLKVAEAILNAAPEPTATPEEETNEMQ